MRSDFELDLEECLAQMRVGMTLEECLSAHPIQANRLRPLLETAIRVREVPIPRASAGAVQAGRERLLVAMNSNNASPLPISPGQINRYKTRGVRSLSTFRPGMRHSRLSVTFSWAVVLAFALLIASGISVKASAHSLPGDKLYRVKRTWENVRLSLAVNQQGRQRLLDQFAEERLDEIQRLIELRRAETVEFEAPLEEVDAEHWKVDGFQVHIDSDTQVEGIPETGQELYIRAQLKNDGTLTAVQVRTLDLKQDDDTIEPTREPQQKRTQIQEPHLTLTQKPSENKEEEGTPKPTETPKPSPTPEATEQHHETPDATKED